MVTVLLTLFSTDVLLKVIFYVQLKLYKISKCQLFFLFQQALLNVESLSSVQARFLCAGALIVQRLRRLLQSWHLRSLDVH